MINRCLALLSPSPVAVLFGLVIAAGCNGGAEDSVTDETLAALTACHLNDGTVEHDALIRACAPQDAKKTTICHVPPGNPANAHTLCIGNAAVPAHLAHHGGDHIGACVSENRCPIPPGKPDGGDHSDPRGTGGTCTHGSGGSTGTCGDTVVSGTGGNTGGGTGGGSTDAGAIIVIP